MQKDGRRRWFHFHWPFTASAGPQVVHVRAAFSGHGGLGGKVAVPFDQTLPWRQKWQDFTTGIQALATTYAGNVIDQNALRQQVENLFADMRELADYLDHDEFGGRSTAKAEVNKLKTPASALEIGDGVTQTTQHQTRHPRRNRDPITGKPGVAEGDNGISVNIAWSAPSGRSGTEDALDLARRCESEWRQFFTAHALTP